MNVLSLHKVVAIEYIDQKFDGFYCKALKIYDAVTDTTFEINLYSEELIPLEVMKSEDHTRKEKGE